MNVSTLLIGCLLFQQTFAAPQFIKTSPGFSDDYDYQGKALCDTARQTLAYINQGPGYDPAVIHGGTVVNIPIERVKATLLFICKNQSKMNNPGFINEHFEFIRWYPDKQHAQQLSANKPLLKNLPADRILMTKYYVHLAKASTVKSSKTPYALYGLPVDEQNLSLEQADSRPDLLRFKYGKQAILAGALEHKPVPSLAFFNRDDLESALLQGTVVAEFANHSKKTFNVHRNNNIDYDRTKAPYQQERYWYFKQVDGVKGYGKDADHKITVNPEVTFAADLEQLGLGKLLLVQYRNKAGTTISKMGILADTGGAFANNLYQVDYLAGSYPGVNAFSQATRQLPDYVDAYFMVVKNQ